MIRSAQVNPPLGLPLFTDVADTTPKAPLGTITMGYDDATGLQAEYIYLQGIAGLVAGDEVTYNVSGVVTAEVAAGSGQATAINTSGAAQYTWFRLKRRGVIA